MAILSALALGETLAPWNGFVTAAGSSDVVPVPMGSSVARKVFWQVIYDVAPTGITFKVQGSADGITWFDLVTSTDVNGAGGLVAAAPYLRGNISGLTKGGNNTTTFKLVLTSGWDLYRDILPGTDLGYNLGNPNFRFGTVYAGLQENVALAAGDGAISLKAGTVHITKGSAAVLTLAAPLAGADDGKVLTIFAETAFAHTVTQSSPGFNNGGAAKDVGTFTAAVGNWFTVEARNGIWWLLGGLNVTFA